MKSSKCPVLFTFLASCLVAASAVAQPQIAVSTKVAAPGESVSITISGVPGANYALLGSTIDAGEGLAQNGLKTRKEATVLATGVLDGTGEATLNVKPPFLGSVLDRFYFQAATS